jgi:hypothetical protein
MANPIATCGGVANTMLAGYFRRQTDVIGENLSVRFPEAPSLDSVAGVISGVAVEEVRPVPNESAIENLKFTECLSPDLAAEVFCARFNDTEAVKQIVGEPRKVIVVQ